MERITEYAQALLLLHHSLRLFGHHWLRWVSDRIGETITAVIILTPLDSSMLNAMQFFPSWEDHMGKPFW